MKPSSRVSQPKSFGPKSTGSLSSDRTNKSLFNMAFCNLVSSCSAAAALLVLSGCIAPGVRDSSTHTKRPGTAIVSPLSVTVENPSSLASVNSLVVLPPTFNSLARSAQIDSERVAELVEVSANEELDLKVYGREWLEKNAPSQKGEGLTERYRSTLKRLGVQGALITEILEYTERVGSSVGGEPAAVGFRLSIVSVDTGKSVWQGVYSLKQEALTDNLLKIGDRFGKEGSGAGWSTGSVVLQKGLADSFQDFRSRREQQFLSTSVKR